MRLIPVLMELSQRVSKLAVHIDAFAAELHCNLCGNLYKSPFTATNCGHIYCYECIQRHLKAGNTECPQCAVPIQGKSLTRNSSYATMVQCITKIRNLLNGTPATQSLPVESQKDVLMSILGGILEPEEKPVPVKESKAKREEETKKLIVKETKKRKSETGKEPITKTLKPTMESNTKSESTQASSNDRYGLLLTGLSEDQKAIIQVNLQKLTKTAGNKPFKVFKDYSAEHVTHIICACAPRSHCPRTLKYLLGVAGKAWIVSFDWVLESLEAGKVLDEAKFVVTGDEAVQCDTNACERSRADPKKLFEGRKFYLAGLFNAPGPSKTDLINLIQTAGGLVSKKHEDGVIVVSNNANGPKAGEMPYTWLFDTISLYEIK